MIVFESLLTAFEASCVFEASGPVAKIELSHKLLLKKVKNIIYLALNKRAKTDQSKK